jgi:recombination protein RecA
LSDIENWREKIAEHLCRPDQLKPPAAVPTLTPAIDQFLLGGGLPKGAVSLLRGPLGSGTTSLWLGGAEHVLKNRRWAAWVDGDAPLYPQILAQRGVSLDQFLLLRCSSLESLFSTLQEVMQSSLFDLVGCDLGHRRLREHQLRKLQTIARRESVALVFLTQLPRPIFAEGSIASLFSLIISCEKSQWLIEKAAHRPTPHCLPRRLSYVRFIHAAAAQANSQIGPQARQQSSAVVHTPIIPDATDAANADESAGAADQ